VSIVGKSGSGKTTLLNILSGFCEADRGEITLSSTNINRFDASKRNISYVFQESPLFPHLNVLQNIKLNSGNYNDEKLAFLIKKSKINHVLKKFPGEISGGEIQRVSVVRSLLRNPNLFLLDEPFSSLDQNTKREVKDLVFEIINELNITTLIVTHDVNDALEISDKIMILDNGEVSSLDTPFNTYTKPKNLTIARLFGRVNKIKIDEDEFFIRPENLFISEQSNFNAVVVHTVFLGEKYRVTATLNNQIIVFYSLENHKKNSRLSLEFKNDDLLNF